MFSSPGFRCSARGGFTLLEMAAVMVMALVLASLVIPAFRNILDKAGAAKCSENLRQIASAALVWTSENNGKLPDKSKWYSTSRGDPYSLLPYLGISNDGQKITQANVLTCPVFNRKYPTTHSPIRTYSISRYAVGSDVDDEKDWEKILGNDPPTRLQRVAQPSRTVFFMDGKPHDGNLSGTSPSSSYRSYAAPDSIGPAATPHLHDGGLNAAFFDGHAERISTAWIEEQQLAVTSRRTNVFWGAGK